MQAVPKVRDTRQPDHRSDRWPAGWSDRWIERWYGLRSRLLMSQKFQNITAKMPVSRMFARHSASGVFDLVAGFVYSQVLLACVQLRVFEILKSGPRSLDDLAAEMAISPDAAQRLLSAAKVLQLVSELSGNRYCLGMRGAAIAGNDGILRMIEHHRLLYADLADPVSLLKGEVRPTRLERYWSYGGSDPAALSDDEVAPYTQLMSRSQALVSSQVLDVYRFSAHRRILDIGGGDGTFLMGVAEHAPQAELVLFDLPAVAARAQVRFNESGLALRAAAVGGNFFEDALPEGADCISMVRVVHDHDDAPVMNLLRRIRAALAPGGTLVIAEPMAGAASAETVGDAYFSFYLMAMGRGRARTAGELATLLRAAGFAYVAEIATPLPLQCKVLIARIDNKTVKTT